MKLKKLASRALHGLRMGLTAVTLFQFCIGAPVVNAQTDESGNTTSPIKHVIVIIGENRSFDHVFATYVPKHGQKVWNLLEEGIESAVASDVGILLSSLLLVAAQNLGGNTFPVLRLFHFCCGGGGGRGGRYC